MSFTFDSAIAGILHQGKYIRQNLVREELLEQSMTIDAMGHEEAAKTR